MGVCGCLWVFVDVWIVCGCLWVFVGVCGCLDSLWVFVGVCGCLDSLWVFVSVWIVCGCLWVFVGLCGCLEDLFGVCLDGFFGGFFWINYLFLFCLVKSCEGSLKGQLSGDVLCVSRCLFGN